jgi:hypothetical protein
MRYMIMPMKVALASEPTQELKVRARPKASKTALA